MSDSSVTNLKTGIRVACPACRTVYQLREELLGKRVSCARCEAQWRAIGPEVLQAAGDAVCEVEAELIELTSGHDKTATLRPGTRLPYDD